jgi:hypothetical protein
MGTIIGSDGIAQQGDDVDRAKKPRRMHAYCQTILAGRARLVSSSLRSAGHVLDRPAGEMALAECPDQVPNDIPRPLLGLASDGGVCPVSAVGAVVCCDTIGGIITSGAQTGRPSDARSVRLTSGAGSRQIHGYLLHDA